MACWWQTLDREAPRQYLLTFRYAFWKPSELTAGDNCTEFPAGKLRLYRHRLRDSGRIG